MTNQANRRTNPPPPIGVQGYLAFMSCSPSRRVNNRHTLLIIRYHIQRKLFLHSFVHSSLLKLGHLKGFTSNYFTLYVHVDKAYNRVIQFIVLTIPTWLTKLNMQIWFLDRGT